MTDVPVGERAGAAEPRPTRHVVVIGVSGSGKSTVAAAIAQRTGYVLGEADDFHSAANIAKMSAGVALTDEDRWPWLQALAGWMREQSAAGRSTVLACSALRRSYRDVLRGGPPRLDLVLLQGPSEVIHERILGRHGHFMPATLLDSQLATLEPLAPDEGGIVLDIRAAPDELADQAVARLGLAR